MSGGAYDYLYFKVEKFAVDITTDNDGEKRKMFSSLLHLISDAMRMIELVDSGDCSDGDEHEYIDAIFNFIKEKK